MKHSVAPGAPSFLEEGVVVEVLIRPAQNLRDAMAHDKIEAMIMLSEAQEDGDVAGAIPRYEATGQLEVSRRVSALADRGTGNQWQCVLLEDLKRVYAAHCEADPDGASAVMSALLAACDEYARTWAELRVLFYRI